FALRFARISRFRDDKRPDDADTLQRLQQLYELNTQGIALRSSNTRESALVPVRLIGREARLSVPSSGKGVTCRKNARNSGQPFTSTSYLSREISANRSIVSTHSTGGPSSSWPNEESSRAWITCSKCRCAIARFP